MYGINGLVYIPDYLSMQHHNWLMAQIDAETWDTSLKRRVQHYGYRYDYKARKVTSDMHLGPLPSWLARISTQLTNDGFISAKPDQVIVNEYFPGQGIAHHIDCEPCFGEKIFSISLGSAAMMTFKKPDTETVELMLAPRSLLMMYGDARYHWKHGIPARQSDKGHKRDRRISLTFRRVTL